MTEEQCSVCIDNFLFQSTLPCFHKFCFFCIKSLKKCPICRKNFDWSQVEINKEYLIKLNEYVWFYEGANGWWQYDDRTSSEIEEFFKNDYKECRILISGNIYTINFERMLQIPQKHLSKNRAIKSNN